MPFQADGFSDFALLPCVHACVCALEEPIKTDTATDRQSIGMGRWWRVGGRFRENKLWWKWRVIKGKNDSDIVDAWLVLDDWKVFKMTSLRCFCWLIYLQSNNQEENDNVCMYLYREERKWLQINEYCISLEKIIYAHTWTGSPTHAF